MQSAAPAFMTEHSHNLSNKSRRHRPGQHHLVAPFWCEHGGIFCSPSQMASTPLQPEMPPHSGLAASIDSTWVHAVQHQGLLVESRANLVLGALYEQQQ